MGNGPQREREDGSPVDLGSPAPTTPSLQLSVTKKGVGLELTEPGAELAILPTYTAMLRLRAIATQRGLTRPYWES